MMQEKIKGILFDLDGTLLDTAKDLTYALNLSLADHGYAPVSEQLVKESVSQGSLIICQTALPTQPVEIQLRVQKTMLKHYQDVSGHKTDFFNGIDSLINRLDCHGLSYGIVTNKVAKFARPLVAKFELFTQNTTLISGDSTTHNKPNAQPMLLAAQQLNLLSSDIIYVGDSRTDIYAAKNAGMKSAIATWGYISSGEKISDWNADLILNDPNDLLSLFNF
ncbi:HAD family hydrolase [Parashewanella curva]|uniref:HAD family hydrolase n=1 Tax=Parashewanella curva TaxID=2338552 RepID=A0A3L8Q176_9GAMM|nr:HAD-IA family hydrolase [Parashewanella curva]RLV61210.1 HAD family hydrolase [Parashewanella curva]